MSNSSVDKLLIWIHFRSPGSPLSSSLTSSPSTVNSSIQYLNHQPQPSHLAKSYAHHGNSTTTIYPQHQQFQQLQQFNSQFQPNYKDTRWLTLEVCREFQRNKCNRNETECKFAHPPSHVEIINGKVIACYDSLKVRIKNHSKSSPIWHNLCTIYP